MSDSTNAKSIEKYRSYLGLLARSYISPQLQRKIDASDLVQQTIIETYADADKYRDLDDQEQLALLRRILKNNLLDEIRKLNRQKRDIKRERAIESAIDQSFGRADGWLAASQTSPSGVIMRQEQLVQLTTALEQLPEDQQQAIVLRHLQGLTVAEIAETILKSESAVGGLLYRGLKKLNQIMASEATGDGA